MATDYYITDSGDLAVSMNGDIATTPNSKEQIRQQANLRLATQRGDFYPYRMLGADLQRLVGLPNTVETARFGAKLIERTLAYDNFVVNGAVVFKEITPTAPDTLVFEFAIPYGTREYINITLTQLLTVA
jgi:hypothetical protein